MEIDSYDEIWKSFDISIFKDIQKCIVKYTDNFVMLNDCYIPDEFRIININKTLNTFAFVSGQETYELHNILKTMQK